MDSGSKRKMTREWHSQENVENWIEQGIDHCPYCGELLWVKKTTAMEEWNEWMFEQADKGLEITIAEGEKKLKELETKYGKKERQ